MRLLWRRHGLLFGLGVLFALMATVGFASASTLVGGRGQTAAACPDICIYLRRGGAEPQSLSVPVGSFVQFNSADGLTHNLSLGGGGEHHDHYGTFHSGDFRTGEAWRIRFSQDGTYLFHDHHHPNISILVVVYTPGKTYRL